MLISLDRQGIKIKIVSKLPLKNYGKFIQQIWKIYPTNKKNQPQIIYKWSKN